MTTDGRGQRLGFLLLGVGFLVALGLAKPLAAEASGLTDGLLGSVPIIQPTSTPPAAQSAPTSPESSWMASALPGSGQVVPSPYGPTPTVPASPDSSPPADGSGNPADGAAKDLPAKITPLTDAVQKTVDAVGNRAAALTDPVTAGPHVAQPTSDARRLTSDLKSVDSAMKPLLQTLEPVGSPMPQVVPSVSRALGQAVPPLPEPLQEPDLKGVPPPQGPETASSPVLPTIAGAGAVPTADGLDPPGEAGHVIRAPMVGGTTSEPLAPKQQGPPMQPANGVMMTPPSSAGGSSSSGGSNAPPDWHGGNASAVLPDDPLQLGMEGTRLPVMAKFLADQWVHAPPGPPPRALLLF